MDSKLLLLTKNLKKINTLTSDLDKYTKEVENTINNINDELKNVSNVVLDQFLQSNKTKNNFSTMESYIFLNNVCKMLSDDKSPLCYKKEQYTSFIRIFMNIFDCINNKSVEKNTQLEIEKLILDVLFTTEQIRLEEFFNVIRKGKSIKDFTIEFFIYTFNNLTYYSNGTYYFTSLENVDYSLYIENKNKNMSNFEKFKSKILTILKIN